jgi:hypothetical protein
MLSVVYVSSATQENLNSLCEREYNNKELVRNFRMSFFNLIYAISVETIFRMKVEYSLGCGAVSENFCFQNQTQADYISSSLSYALLA